MKELSDFSFTLKAYNQDMQRLRGGRESLNLQSLLYNCFQFHVIHVTGPLVKELVDHLKDYAHGQLTPPNRKLFMYSAHDVSVSTFLSALKIFNDIQPPYASMVLVELHELQPNNFSVQVRLELFQQGINENRFLQDTIIFIWKTDFVQERVWWWSPSVGSVSTRL